ATSGIMLIAHSKAIAKALSTLFADRLIKKTYLAIVSGDFPHKKISLTFYIDGKHALSHITKLAQNEQKSLLSVHIETGRKHQIRKHLSEIDFPIIGDRLYGTAKKNHPEDLQLQAINLAFNCPIDQQPINITLSDKDQLKL
nr:RNA pseudouridine synthase [Pseudomonadota bacterium]